MANIESINDGLRELSLFAGTGGGILGGTLLGWRTVCAVEIEPYAASVLLQRQNDGILPPFPIWDDVRTFSGLDWRGIVDVISGGFPCQDISCAGKGAGITGERSGLWKEFARIIREVEPLYVFVENSPLLKKRGLDVVLGNLHEMGYDAEWGVIGADDAGAPHKRKRNWIVARARDVADSEGVGRRDGLPEDIRAQRGQGYALGNSREILADAEGIRGRGRFCKTAQEQNGNQFADSGTNVSYPNSTGREKQWSAVANGTEYKAVECGNWWLFEPDVGRMADRMAARVDRLKAIGNGQVPAVAALAWNILIERLNNEP
jgi:DNA (cytosine-5)-methyltransferase 1